MYREAIGPFSRRPAQKMHLLKKQGIAFHQLLQSITPVGATSMPSRSKHDYVERDQQPGPIYYTGKASGGLTYYNRAMHAGADTAENRRPSIWNLGTAFFAASGTSGLRGYQTAMRLDDDVLERQGNFGVMMEERTVEDRANSTTTGEAVAQGRPQRVANSSIAQGARRGA